MAFSTGHSLQESEHFYSALEFLVTCLMEQESNNQSKTCLHSIERLGVGKVHVLVCEEKADKSLHEKSEEAHFDAVVKLCRARFFREIGSDGKVINVH